MWVQGLILRGAFVLALLGCSGRDFSSAPEPGQPSLPPETERLKRVSVEPAAGIPLDGPMVIVGDSIGAGVLADTQLGQPPNARARESLAKVFRIGGTLGAFDKEFRRPELAGLGGDGEDLLPTRLREWSGNPQLRVVNVSHSGRKWSDARRMVENDLSAPLQGEMPSLVLFPLGANDLCAGRPIPDVLRDASDVLDVVASRYPQAVVALVPPPPVQEVLTFSGTIPIESFGISFDMDVSHVRERICRKLTDPNLAAAHAALREGLARLRESHPASPLVLESVSRSRVKAQDLAVDGFHASALGQKAMAQEVFADLSEALSRRAPKPLQHLAESGAPSSY